jgi:hypothetical protein
VWVARPELPNSDCPLPTAPEARQDPSRSHRTVWRARVARPNRRRGRGSSRHRARTPRAFAHRDRRTTDVEPPLSHRFVACRPDRAPPCSGRVLRKSNLARDRSRPCLPEVRGAFRVANRPSRVPTHERRGATLARRGSASPRVHLAPRLKGGPSSSPSVDDARACRGDGRGDVSSTPYMISPTTCSGSAQRSSYVAVLVAGSAMPGSLPGPVTQANPAETRRQCLPAPKARWRSKQPRVTAAKVIASALSSSARPNRSVGRAYGGPSRVR